MDERFVVIDLTEKQAKELAASKFWESLSDYEIVKFQLFTKRLCLPIDLFQEALERILDRPVWTHELGLNVPGLQAEFLNEADKPSIKDIINLIPEEKRILIGI